MSALKNSKYALEPTAVLHLRDGNDDLMYADGEDGKPDLKKPMLWKLYGPGTKKYAEARAATQSKNIERIKKRGKTEVSAKEQVEETADFILKCTAGTENLDYDGSLTGEAMQRAILADLELSFIPAQIEKWLGDTANFTKALLKG
jgi:hypothetical protein